MDEQQAREAARDVAEVASRDRLLDADTLHSWIDDELDAMHGLHLAGRSGMDDRAYAAYQGELELIRIERERSDDIDLEDGGIVTAMLREEAS